MKNPFSLIYPPESIAFISRKNQIDKIIHTFDMKNPSNKVFMIAGFRGSVHGELTFALPRFEEYIEMYCEVNL